MKFFYFKSFPKNEEDIIFQPNLGELPLLYKYPNKNFEKFIATEWLAKKFFLLMDLDIFYEVLIRILSEQSFIFICDNIEYLTTLV